MTTRTTVAVAVVLVAGTALVGVAGAQTNELVNPSCEQTPGATASEWNNPDISCDDGANYGTPTPDGLYIFADNSQDFITEEAYQDISVSGGEVYNVSGAYATDLFDSSSDQAEVVVRFRSGGSQIDSTTVLGPSQSDATWTRFSGDVTVPSNADTLRVVLRFIENDAIGFSEAYYDDLSVEQVPVPTLDLDTGASGSDATVTFDEDADGGTGTSAGVAVAGPVSTSDSDGTIDSATITLENPQGDTGEGLAIDTSSLSSALGFAVSNDQITITRNGATNAELVAAIEAVRFQLDTDDPTTTDRTVTVTVTDDTGQTTSATSTVTVQAVNDAPTLTTDTRTLNPINEDGTSNPGTEVSTLLGSAGSAFDPDDSELGVAVTAVDTANGTWEYSTDGGSSWQSVGSVSTSNARLLSANDYLRFVPDSDYNGVATGTIRAWDGSSGSSGNTADTTTNGGTTPYSTNRAGIEITINAVNDSPTIDTNAGVTVDEGSTANRISSDDLAASDLEQADGSLTYDVTTAVDSGTLFVDGSGSGTDDGTLDGETPIGTGTFTQADIDSGDLLYSHDGSETTSDSFDFTLLDGNGGSTAGTFLINVDPVNDPPTDLGLTSTTVAQSGGTDARVGGFTATDPDDSSFLVRLASGPGDDDNGKFSVDGPDLVADDASALSAGTYSVRLEVDDQSGGTYQESFSISVVDDVAPTLASSDPSDGATAHPPDDDLVLTFSEPVAFGSGQIELRNVDAGVTVETFDVTNDTGGGAGTVSVSGDTLTIEPGSTLREQTEYAVRIDATAIEDTAATPNSYAGISTDDGLNFTTVDTTAPAVDSITRSTSDRVTSADTAAFTVAFSEPVEGISTDDFDLTGDASGTVDSVSTASGSSVTVTITSVTGDGSLGLDLVDSGDITDPAGNALDTTEPATDETFVIDNTAPSLDIATRVDDTTIEVILSDAGSGLDRASIDAADFTTDVGSITSIDTSGVTDGATGSQTVTVSLLAKVDSDEVTVSLRSGTGGISDGVSNARTTGSATATGMDGLSPSAIAIEDPTGELVREPDGSLTVNYSYTESNPDTTTIVLEDGGNTATFEIDDSGYAADGSTRTVTLDLSDPDSVGGNGLVNGTYDLTVEAADTSSQVTGIVRRDVVTIVDSTAPSAVAQANETVVQGEQFTLDATGSTDNDGIRLYAWDFDGDNAYEKAGKTVNHSFATTGTKTITLRVTDTAGNTDFTTVKVTVERAFRVTSVTAPSTIETGATRQATATIANNGTNGTYRATLTVNGSAVATKSVVVPAGDTATVTFELRFGTPGVRTLAVGGRTRQITVQPAGQPTPIEILRSDDGRISDAELDDVVRLYRQGDPLPGYGQLSAADVTAVIAAHNDRSS